MVDSDGYRLIDKERPTVSIHGYEMRYSDSGYRFAYSRKYKTLANPHDDEGDDIILVHLLHFTEMDPEGVARKYGLKAEEAKGKTDYEIMADKRALIDRMRGRLTTVDIDGHTFFVDFPMECLRPKDNFFSRGIPFSKFDEFYNEETNRYDLPYNRKTQELEPMDYENIVEHPRNVLIASIPPSDQLDPVGYARARGFTVEFMLGEHPQRAHFKAKILQGEASWLNGIIRENRERLGYRSPVKKRRGKKL